MKMYMEKSGEKQERETLTNAMSVRFSLKTCHGKLESKGVSFMKIAGLCIYVYEMLYCIVYDAVMKLYIQLRKIVVYCICSD